MHEIWAYLAVESGSLEVAEKVVDAIFATLRILGRSPGVGRDRSEDLRPGLRSFPSGRYLIFYRIVGSTVKIVRVLHASRDIQTALGE
jgi:toxin ParE1/3/4